LPTTSSSGLRYPASSAAPNVPADIQNLATDLDTKVIVQVANTTARNALTKFDGQRVYEQSTKRTFRWDGTNTRWEHESGPAYTWTPTLQDLSGNPVTGTITSRGTYRIEGAFLQFKVDMVFSGSIDGRAGAAAAVANIFPARSGGRCPARRSARSGARAAASASTSPSTRARRSTTSTWAPATTRTCTCAATARSSRTSTWTCRRGPAPTATASMIWVETQGGTTAADVKSGQWVGPQFETLARIAAWAHNTEGVPLD
jgi:hypothetical protein